MADESQCNFIAPFTGFQTTDWYTNIRSHRSSDAGGPLVMDCGQDQLDPESGPYLTLYPDGVKLRLDKRPGLELFDGATIGSFDKTTEHISGATFKGVAYMKWPWDNIGFTVITQRFSYSVSSVQELSLMADIVEYQLNVCSAWSALVMDMTKPRMLYSAFERTRYLLIRTKTRLERRGRSRIM